MTSSAGPIDARSAAGQALLAQVRVALPRQPRSLVEGSTNYEPLRLQKDRLGICHVRMQRQMAGVPIFGEHVNAQVHQDGSVRFVGTPPEALEHLAPVSSRPALSADVALKRALDDCQPSYAMSSSATVNKPALTFFRSRGSDGVPQLRLAYHVRMTDFEATHHGHIEPADISVVVDAQDGRILARWNHIDSPLARTTKDRRLVPTMVGGGADVDRAVGPSSVTIPIDVAEDVHIDAAILQLGTPDNPGVTHAWRGDVVFKVTSPDGVTIGVAPFGADDSADNVSGAVDISTAFAGQRTRGTWIVEVSDRHPGEDDGIVRRVGLEFRGPAVRAPTLAPAADPSRDDYSDFIGNVQLDTQQKNGGYVLLSKDGKVETRNAEGRDPNAVAGRFELTTEFRDADDTWGGPNATTTIKAAVETHYAATMFITFLKEHYGLDSLDGQGMKLNAMTNVGRNYNNAFWFNDVIHIGHGDGRVFDRLSTIDIIGHEVAHGVTEKAADLIYDDQSGGLNESYSDIIGTAFEWWLVNRPGAVDNGALPFDWKVGEDTFTPGNNDDDALRYMDDPVRDGRSIDHFSQYDDSVDVHFSSGIQNNAFYLAVEGGTHRLGGQVDGLRARFGGDFNKAMDAASQVWMRALQFYLTPSSRFVAARQATLQAAEDLFPENPDVVGAIAQAWDAVGVS